MVLKKTALPFQQHTVLLLFLNAWFADLINPMVLIDKTKMDFLKDIVRIKMTYRRVIL